MEFVCFDLSKFGIFCISLLLIKLFLIARSCQNALLTFYSTVANNSNYMWYQHRFYTAFVFSI